MKESSYGERDYAFGQLVLGLRTSIGLTQAGLARQLGISRQAVVGWEAGSSYPKATHLKALIALAVKEQVFPVGHEVDGKLAESSDKSERGEPVCPNIQPKNVWPKVRHNFHILTHLLTTHHFSCERCMTDFHPMS